MGLPQETVDYLEAWMMSPEHIYRPYPTKQEKAEIMAETGIELKQLTNWFANKRKRYWKPWVVATTSSRRDRSQHQGLMHMAYMQHLQMQFEQHKKAVSEAAGVMKTNAFMMPPPPPLQHPSLITVPQCISAVKRRVSVDSSSQYQYQVGFHIVAIKKLQREITQKDQDITQLTQAKEAAITRAEAAEKDAKEALLKLECSLCLEINKVQYVMCPCGHVMCTDCNEWGEYRYMNKEVELRQSVQR
eukprot:scaffold2225_cov198-Alexandrium_tamarense.AAC.8